MVGWLQLKLQSWLVKFPIFVIENLGNEKIAYIKKDNHDISAKIPSQNTIKNQIGFSSKNIFVFDENGNRVRS